MPSPSIERTKCTVRDDQRLYHTVGIKCASEPHAFHMKRIGIECADLLRCWRGPEGIEGGDRSIAMKDPLLNRTTTSYDSVGSVRRVTNALNQITTYVYDSNERQVAIIDALGNRNTTVYDQLSRTVASIDPLSNRGAHIQTMSPRGPTTAARSPSARNAYCCNG